MSSNPEIFSNVDGIDNNIHKFDWEGLSKLKSDYISFDILEKYQNYWNYDSLIYNSSLYDNVFKQLLNDEMVFEMMEYFTNSEKIRINSTDSRSVDFREQECIFYALEYIKLENTRNGLASENILIDEKMKNSFPVPDNKSFTELWDMYGFAGNGIGNRNGRNLTMGEMEDCIYFWFETLYLKSPLELKQMEKDIAEERGNMLSNLRDKGIRMTLAHPLLSLPEKIQEKLGNYA